MPIFDNELINNQATGNYELPDEPKSYLGSPTIRDVDVTLPTGGTPSGGEFTGLSIKELSQVGLAAKNTRGFGSPMSMIPRSELLDNQRFGMYVRDVDLENVYSLTQPWYEQLGNGIVKMVGNAIGTFADSFATIPNTVAAVKNGSLAELSGKDGYESDIDVWLKNLEDAFPNYVSKYEREHPYRGIVPFMRGSANFWGDKIIKNIGFTAGAIGGALVQDAAVGLLTEGIGELPLIGAQIGKASLWLNKIFTGTNRLEETLNTARALGKSEKFISNLTGLAQAAESTRLANGFRYGLSLYGSSRTEAAVEARDGYRQVKDELTKQYKQQHDGADPQGADLDEIESYATNAMNTRFGINMALLTASNAIQFGSMMRSVTGSSIENTLADIGKIGLAEGSLDVFEKKAAEGFLPKAWDFVKPKLTNIFAEGVYEEGGQFAAEKGTYDYYTRKYKNRNNPEINKTWNSVDEVMTSTNFGLAQQFGSQEGIENMLVGALSALITGGISGRIEKAMGATTGDEKLQSAINVLNRYGLTGMLKDKYENTGNSANIAREMQDAADSGNVFKYKNLKHDQFFGFVASRIPSGMHEVTIEQLRMLKDLDKEQFEQTFGMDFNSSNKKTVGAYVDSLIEKANKIKSSVDSINSTFGNPYKSYINPATPEEEQSNERHDLVNEWKTNLAYYSTVADDVNDRLANIQTDVSGINANIDNSTLSNLTRVDGLKELSKSYEEQANNLSKTITDYTTPEDKKRIKAEIKSLRTASERINLAINNQNLDVKTFESLLNFELSGRTDLNSKNYPTERSTQLYGYGVDINGLEGLKRDASDSFDNLASEEGFNKFFDQAEQVKKDKEEIPAIPEEGEKPETLETPEYKAPEFVNKAGVKETPEINRTYENLAPKKAKVEKIADDRWQVTSPTGEVTFHTSQERADDEAADMNEDVADLGKVKVLALNDDGTVKVEDAAGNVQNIDPQLLTGHERVETEQEKLLKNKEKLNKQQNNLEKKSGNANTEDSASMVGDEEGKRKDISILFPSTTTQSESEDEVAAHVTRSMEFLNNVKNFPNKESVRVILVTPGQEAALGLTGLSALSFRVTAEEAASEEFKAKVNDPYGGFLGAVFVTEEGGKVYFVGKDGKKLNQVGEQVNLDEVIFQTMPTPDLYYNATDRNGNPIPRFRSNQEEEAEAYSNAWKETRANLFAAPADAFTIYDFTISRGVAEKGDEQNHVGDVLIPEKKIGSQEGLLKISVTGQISHNGQSIGFSRGSIVLQYGDTLQIVDNRTFTDNEANTIYKILENISEKFKKNGELDDTYSRFLQNVLYWKRGKSPSKNQVFIDESTMNLRIAGLDIPISEIADRKDEIIDELKKTYNNVNNSTLKDASEKFIEYYLEGDEIKEREWKNYQSYLLSSKFPDGSARPVSETPITTSVVKPSDGVPYSYKQKYATLEGLELNVKYVPKAEPVKAAAPAGAPKIGEYVVDGTTQNTYSLSGNRNINFTASVDDAGEVDVNIIAEDPETLKTLNGIASNKNSMKDVVIPGLKGANKFDAEKEDIELVADFMALKLSAELKEMNKKAPETKEPVVTAAPVSTEAKPAEPTSIDETLNPSDDGDFKVVAPGEEKAGKIQDVDIELFKQYVAEKVPNIPYEVMEELIRRNGNITAWGVFEKGVVKFYKHSPRGTEYHELFHPIWLGFLSEERRQEIRDEFRSNRGTFTERKSGKKINYADASDKQIEERLADDFGDFRLGKLPAASFGEKVLRFFRAIIEFFKSFGRNDQKKRELFDAIEEGKFKEAKLGEEVRDSEFTRYKEIEGLTQRQVADYVDDMTARASGYLFLNAKKLLYSPGKVTGADVFGYIKERYEAENKYAFLGDGRYSELVRKTKEKLRTLGVDFDQEDRVNINDENHDKNSYAADAFTTNWKKNSPFAVKFTLSTLLMTEAMNQENSLSLQLPKAVISSIKGYRLLNFSTAFATVLDKLANTTDISEAVTKLAELAGADSNYVRLFRNVGGKLSDKTMPFQDFKAEDWRFFINFMQTFGKQRPDAFVQYINGNETYTQPSNTQTAAKQIQDDWVGTMKRLSRKPKSLIVYNSNNKTYGVNSKAFAESWPTAPKTGAKMVTFLNSLGVTFTIEDWKKLKTKGGDRSERNQFSNAVNSIYTYLQETPELVDVTSKTLKITTQLNTLAKLQVSVNNPLQDITYFGIDRKRMQSYVDNNAASVFENEFNEANTLDELLNKRPELTDVFSAGSEILRKGGLFFNEEGIRIRKIKVQTVQGSDFVGEDKSMGISKLSVGERFALEINQNLNGSYYILIPADSSTEWMMDMGNHVSFKEIASKSERAWTGKDGIYSIFKRYLIDDVALALDSANRDSLKNLKGRSKELRFFKDILPESILKKINVMIANNFTQESIEEYIDNNLDAINASVREYIDNTVTETISTLTQNDQIQRVGEDAFAYARLDDKFARKEGINKDKNLTEKQIKDIITFANVNYIINNIEFHKVLFGDPYQFAEKEGQLDETKRIKSFLSPRRTTFDSPEFNTFLNQNLNNVDGIDLEEDDLGYHDHKSYTNTITLKDEKIAGSLANIMSAFGSVTETDAASWLMDTTYREVKLKNAQWGDESEAFHQWQMANARKKLAAKGEYTYTNDNLKKQDIEITSKPSPKFTLEILKPIVSGNKFGKTNFDLVLDKFSQMPIYYSMAEGTNLEKLYIKMWKENVGYAVFESGRKVGAEETHRLYNQNGSFNEEAFKGIVPVSWKSYGIQVENSYENPKAQTRGSQLTKLASINLFSNGEVFNVKSKARAEYIKKEFDRNKELLKQMHIDGYNRLLKRLGIVDNGQGFVLEDNKAISEVLVYEMLRREMSENAKDTVQTDENDQFRIPFEASPSYVQIRTIMYSLIDKSIVSPAVSGGSYVQVPVTGFEKLDSNRGLAIKENGKWKKISQEEFNNLSDEKKKKVVLTDDTLKFYTKEDPYCEVMLPHWFREKLDPRKFKTDEQILTYLNSTEEGKAILRGIGFRIPTQEMSSVETFRVKGFLPQYMGYTVIVPSEITTKAGSDFDIDKLNMYLKATYIDKNGDIRLVKLRGDETTTKEFYGKVFDEKLDAYKGRLEDLLTQVVFTDEEEDTAGEEVFDRLKKLNDKELQATLRDKFVDDMYKNALENEYYDSLEKLITLPENFNRLISPVDDGGLKDLAGKLDDLRGEDEAAIKNRILDRNYMTNLRHAFVTAKRWVGIAAVNITNHSMTQKTKVYIDPARFGNVSEFDQKYLGDGSIVLPHNTVKINGKDYISMSGVTDTNGKTYISSTLSGYITSFVDVAKNPYILKVIKSNLSVGTFMYLTRIGVPIDTLSMFLNQPIIAEYLEMLDGKGAKGLFGQGNIDEILMRFPATKEERKAAVINLDNLENNIKDYYQSKKQTMSGPKNAEQQRIFAQFLRYAKMAEYNFKFTQAINYDTTKFRSGDALSQKQTKTAIAQEANIISSVQEVLDANFVGDQERILNSSVDAMSAVFKLDSPKFKIITDKILDHYKAKEFISQEDYDRMANKIKTSFVDYIIQTKQGLTEQIKPLLVQIGNSITDRLAEAKEKHPEIQILRMLKAEPASVEGGATSVSLIANVKDAATEDMYIGMMRELRNNPDTRALYDDLVLTSIFQGTYQSPISIRNIIPVEDFGKIAGPIISSLTSTEDLKAFAEGAFQRNNWKDENVFYQIDKILFVPTSKSPLTNNYLDEAIYQYWSPQFPNIDILDLKSSDRRVLYLDSKYDSTAIASGDYVKIPRAITTKVKGGGYVNMETGNEVTGREYATRLEKGDNSLSTVYGYQKVKNPDGTPFTVSIFNELNKTTETKQVYKLINLYGDAPKVSEYYNDFRPSQLNNGTVRMRNELSDDEIIAALAPEIDKETLPLQPLSGKQISPEGLPSIDDENQNSCKQ